MINSTELTNSDLQIYKTEYEKLLMEKRRVELHINAILTTASIELDKSFNTNRLDFAHISNAYQMFVSGDTDSMQFRIADTTIRDLFLPCEQEFKFTTIVPHEQAYEFIYQYHDRTISIKIPTAPTVTKDNIESLNWGVFTVYEITKRTDISTEKIELIRSDNADNIKSKLSDLLIGTNAMCYSEE